MSSRVCSHCGCSDIDIDSARGDAVCTSCGSVLEDQIIVSEVQFAENAGGGSSVIGQYVSAEGNKSHSMGSGFHHGLGKESREITLQNGKKKIQQLGGQLRLNQHCIDTAYNFFKMAVSRRLTRGRKTTHVIAACVYLVCRTEGTPHMLLDFSDVLQVNVYALGRTYLQLSRELCINIPALDPCLYIHRFAHKLEFGEKTHDVSMTALRLVSRMKRDWMAQGRRPSGLCGAALLVAARINDFNRSIKEIIKVVKIGEGTIRKRLAEFEQTPSSQLTVDEFQKIDLEEEMDPPCYTLGRKKAKIAQLEESGQLNMLTSEISELQSEIEQVLEEASAKKGKRHRNCSKDPDSLSLCSSAPSQADFDDEELSQINDFVEKEIIDTNSEQSPSSSDPSKSQSENSDDVTCKSESDKEKADSSETEKSDIELAKLERQEWDSILMPPPGGGGGYGPRPTAASLGLKESIEECMTVQESKEEDKDLGILTLDGIDDEELEIYILTAEEVKMKTRIWLAANADYLKELKEKQEREAQLAAEEAAKPESQKKKKKPRKKAPAKEANSAGEAIEKMLQERKISSKINYDVLRNLNQGPNIKKEEKGPLLGEGPIEIKPVNLGAPKRFRRPSFSADSKADIKPVVDKKPRLETIEPEVVVESGPVQYDQDDEAEAEEEEEEEEEHMSAAQLMGHDTGDEDYGDGEMYDEDMD